MYRVYCVNVRKEDQDMAETILRAHWLQGDIDSTVVNEQKNSNGSVVVSYWIGPYVYEDLLAIMNEFKLKGIHVT